jgi:glycosyltransferase involved in cell wall biosynthesis
VRILHVIQELETGGAERVVLALTAGGRDEGHAVAIAAAPGAFGPEAGGEQFELPRVERRVSRLPAAALALRRAVRRWRPDLLHCHNPGMALVAALATARGHTHPCVVTVHGVPDEDYSAAARLLRAMGMPVVACGPGVEEGLAEHGLSAELTIVNGIGPPPPPAQRGSLEEQLGVKFARRLVVAVGRLAPIKNHALAIDAVARVPDTTLLLVGDGPLRADLERRAREAGLSDRVVLAGLRPDARAVVGAADAFVLSSVAEGLPLAALEALAAGTPVVATAVRGVRELVENGESALLAPPGDSGALASALQAVLDDPTVAARLRAGGQEVAAGYTERAMVDRYLRLYERIARSERP